MLQFFRTLSQCVTPVDQGAEVGNVEKDVHCLAWIVLQVLGLGGIDLDVSTELIFGATGATGGRVKFSPVG